MSKNNVLDMAKFVLNELEKAYVNAEIELDYDHHDPWQLLVVVSLSAQSTDKKVNEISRDLFKRFKNVEDFACSKAQDVEPYIKKLGLFRNKAKNLILAAQKIIAEFSGQVPKDRAALESLAGVGKKTAAVIIANAFGIPAIAVDTHVSRVSQRLGLSNNKDPHKIEEDLTRLFPKNMLLLAHHRFILHGRRVCLARKPKCSMCTLESRCPKIGVILSQ